MNKTFLILLGKTVVAVGEKKPLDAKIEMSFLPRLFSTERGSKRERGKTATQPKTEHSPLSPKLEPNKNKPKLSHVPRIFGKSLFYFSLRSRTLRSAKKGLRQAVTFYCLSRLLLFVYISGLWWREEEEKPKRGLKRALNRGEINATKTRKKRPPSGQLSVSLLLDPEEKSQIKRVPKRRVFFTSKGCGQCLLWNR